MSLYAYELDIGLDFWHMWIGPTCPNNNILLFYFLSKLVCAQQLLLKQCSYSVMYNFS